MGLAVSENETFGSAREPGGLLVQDFLRRGGTLADLVARYSIKVTRGERHPSLALLKYNQIESPMAEPIVRECRGLILDESEGWRVASRSFDKFFNHGEGHAAAIDWATARVQEKLDGSLCVLYWHGGAWRVQTSGHPEAGGRVNDAAMTFADLFWEVFGLEGYSLPSEEHRDLCIAFELMTKHNRVVVRHEEPRLTMIGIRCRSTQQERPLGLLDHRYRPVRSFGLQSFEDIAATFSSMEPLRQEGYVVVDGSFNRVKVKHPGYVAIHHLKDGHSTRRLVEIVQSGEVGEFLTYFPEWRSEFEEIQNGLSAVEAQLEADYARLRDIPDQKAFALEAVKTKCSAALFSVRAKKAGSVREFLNRQQPDAIIRMLGIKDRPAESAAP
jgi:hypothetical protein